ncbi:NAD(P)-binding protein [Tilletiaria anomala UBC 951]|uniref:NAD(P)-binding protein n=1 Tax=Tilletiaria anomala (strain ATCC 24038 / CBS 436.72 / UBC 951) TaxID=1037660 RepID=A0A066WGM8_TILAU|nr:NAD(P)-binding protein [Tilletiaria anomala UBC 951]KDN52946.1 NAD(P)-binding protein [Tilletiaria anomala UBC 951]
MPNAQSQPNVLCCGIGEYTTGFVGTGASKSDKKVGVVGLTMFDLRRRGLLGKDISMVGTNGDKFDGIRNHLTQNIENKYRDMDTTFTAYPEPGKRDPEAYKAAIDKLKPGDAITIFTPDTTHFPIAVYAMKRKIHVLVTKPAVKTLKDHLELARIAKEEGVLCFVEHHKRFDPAYADARDKAREDLGDLSYFYAYMSQPKTQLETFKAWAGRDSDISYYLSSHHVDILDWYIQERAVPTRVMANGALGIANAEPFNCPPETEDNITLLVDYAILDAKTQQPLAHRRATGVFTASWAAPTGAGVHSEQHFHYVGTKGELKLNQSRRGYSCVREEGAGAGNTDFNPFYMKYAPDADGYFDGQTGYGYRSLELFIRACTEINSGRRDAQSYTGKLPTIHDTVATTAILEAGRRSLDEKRPINIKKQGDAWTLV